MTEPENPEEPPTTKKSWWQKYKEDILIWTSLGSFVIGLLQFLFLMVR